MNPNTVQLIKTVLESDHTISDEDKDRIAKTLSSPTKKDKLLTRKQVADMLGICPKSVERYSNRGYFNAVRFSARKLRYKLSEIEQFMFNGIDGMGVAG